MVSFIYDEHIQTHIQTKEMCIKVFSYVNQTYFIESVYFMYEFEAQKLLLLIFIFQKDIFFLRIFSFCWYWLIRLLLVYIVHCCVSYCYCCCCFSFSFFFQNILCFDAIKNHVFLYILLVNINKHAVRYRSWKQKFCRIKTDKLKKNIIGFRSDQH